MASFGTRLAVAGGAFVALQLWESIRARRSLDKWALEQADPHGGLMSFSEYLAARREFVQGPPKLLDVKNFSLENLEGAKAPANSLSLR